jgi:predicted GH43/DUF377 family glycosyl hydrolase
VNWKKLGNIFCPNQNSAWMVSHASNPVAEPRQGSLFRIYFSCRDAQNRSHIGWIELDLHSPDRVINQSEEPVLSPGPVGTFDDSGVSLGCILKARDSTFLYYVGWNLGVTVPWRNSIGLAIANPKSRKYEKYCPAPIVDRSCVDPFSLSYPCVIEENGIYRMWYGSNLSWGAKPEHMAHVLKYAESQDGIHWDRTGEIAINLKEPAEYGISRPFVLRENGVYRMWYSYRGSAYRIGYAESSDGRKWHRKDHLAGIDVSTTGWDSEMIEYPFVFDYKDQRYLLYCGNGFGKSGFGLAILEP